MKLFYVRMRHVLTRAFLTETFINYNYFAQELADISLPYACDQRCR